MEKFREITQEEFDKIYEEHQLFLKNSSLGARADLSKCDLSTIIFRLFPNLMDINLSGANLSRANLSGVNFGSVNLSGANLLLSDLSDAILSDAILSKANLSKANLSKAYLLGADLSGADLSRTNLSGSLSSFVNLQGANLQGANLRGANLSGANLSESNLLGTDLSATDLSEANLSKCVIYETDFSGSDMTKTNLTRCIISSADFTNAYVSEIIIDPGNVQHIARLQRKTMDPLILSNGNYDNIQQNKLLSLHAELDQLKKNSTDNENLIKEKDNEINALKEELKKRGDEIKEGLNESFNTLSNVAKEMQPEIKRLNKMFCGFFLFSILCFIGLTIIWVLAFTRYHCSIEKIELMKLWIYAVPSSILVAAIWLSIVQMGRAQRQLVALRIFNRRYNITRAALEGYYAVESDVNKTPDKAKEVFNEIISISLKENINIDAEEEKIKTSNSKDQVPIKDVVDGLIDYMQKLKIKE